MNLKKSNEISGVENVFTKEDIENMEKDKQEVKMLFDKLSVKWKKRCMKLFAETSYVLMSTDRGIDKTKNGQILTRIISIIEWWNSKTKLMIATELSTKYDIEQVFKYVEDEKDPDNVPDRISDNEEAGIPIHRPKKKKN